MIVAVHEGVIIAVPVRIIATVTSSQTYLKMSVVSCHHAMYSSSPVLAVTSE